MRILLIKPPINLPANWKGVAFFDPPLGLAYLAAVLERAGHRVDILDAGIEGFKRVSRVDGRRIVGLGPERIRDRVARARPDLVGLTALSVDASNALLVAQAVKAVDPGIPVVLGGAHASVRPTYCLAEGGIDYVVRGEGEEVFLDLVETLAAGRSIDRPGVGLGLTTAGGPEVNPQPGVVADLAGLPLPDRRKLGYDRYFKAARYLQGARGFQHHRATVITSRGCPHACSFCAVRTITGRRYRARSAEAVVDEAAGLVRDFGVIDIGFEDDNISADKKRFRRLLELLVQKELPITWDTPNGIRADHLDEESLRLMKQSGCRGIILAPECGDQEFLDRVVGKGLDLAKVEEAVGLAGRLGLPVACFFIVGLIGETKKTLDKTVALADKLRRQGAKTYCFFAQPYYGTPLYEEARAKGYITRPDGMELEQGYIDMQPMIETPELPLAELIPYRDKVGAGASEAADMLYLIKRRPLDALRCFSLHPLTISGYLVRRRLLGQAV